MELIEDQKRYIVIGLIELAEQLFELWIETLPYQWSLCQNDYFYFRFYVCDKFISSKTWL